MNRPGMHTTAEKRVEIQISGRVQGVGFRYFVTRAAGRLGLTGWVRNERDGSVLVVAEGDTAALKELIASLKRGPSSARVEDVRCEWDRGTGEFQSFTVRH